jgi:hypothetical protein
MWAAHRHLPLDEEMGLVNRRHRHQQYVAWQQGNQADEQQAQVLLGEPRQRTRRLLAPAGRCSPRPLLTARPGPPQPSYCS